MQKMETMKKFPVSIPVDLHRRFKTKCAAEGTMMSEVVRKLLERECEATSAAPTEPVARRGARRPVKANAMHAAE